MRVKFLGSKKIIQHFLTAERVGGPDPRHCSGLTVMMQMSIGLILSRYGPVNLTQTQMSTRNFIVTCG